jgi:hypothetical protein
MRTIPHVLIAFAVSAFCLPAQEDAAAKKEPDPKVEALLDDLDKAVKDRKFELDKRAVEIIDGLQARYEDLHPKDQRSFLNSLAKVFRAKKRKPDTPGQLYEATLTCIGTIGGKDASRVLLRVYKSKQFDDREWIKVGMQQVLLENLGRTKDEKMIEILVDVATRDPSDPIKAAAGKALRHFSESKQPVRKDIVKRLLRDYGKIEGEANGLDLNSEIRTTRRRTLAAIADVWNTTLQAMTGQKFRTAEDWQHWYTKNKTDPKAWR